MPVIGNMLFAEEGGQISPEFYTMLFTMHATVMIFFVIIPILAGCIRELPDPADDWRRRHGVPNFEHAELLVHVAGLLCASDCQLLHARYMVPPQAGRPTRRYRRCLGGRARAVAIGSNNVADRNHIRRCLVDDGFGQLL